MSTQITVPVAPDGTLVDSGRWRELGVTHWHLSRLDSRRSDKDRWGEERVRLARTRPSHGVAHDPGEVADWLREEAVRAIKEGPAGEDMLRASGRLDEESERIRYEMRFWSAMSGRDCYAMAGTSSQRVVDLVAFAMTVRDCTRHGEQDAQSSSPIDGTT